MQVDLLVLLGLLGGIGAVGTYAVGALRGIKKWVRATAASCIRHGQFSLVSFGVRWTPCSFVR